MPSLSFPKRGQAQPAILACQVQHGGGADWHTAAKQSDYRHLPALPRLLLAGYSPLCPHVQTSCVLKTLLSCGLWESALIIHLRSPQPFSLFNLVPLVPGLREALGRAGHEAQSHTTHRGQPQLRWTARQDYRKTCLTPF